MFWKKLQLATRADLMGPYPIWAYLQAFIDTQDPRDCIPHQHQHLHCATCPLALAPDGIHQQEAFASWQAPGSDQLLHLCQYSMSFSFRTHSCRGPDKLGPVLYPNWVRYHHPGTCGMLQLFFQNVYDFFISCKFTETKQLVHQ